MTDQDSNATMTTEPMTTEPMTTEPMSTEPMPAEVAAIVECGYATWATDDVDPILRARFKATRIPVVGVRHVRIWGLQVDDERELPGRERTQIPDDDIWEVNLRAIDGSKFEVDSTLLRPAK